MELTEQDKETIINLSKMENKEHLINYINALLKFAYSGGKLDGKLEMLKIKEK